MKQKNFTQQSRLPDTSTPAWISKLLALIILIGLSSPQIVLGQVANATDDVITLTTQPTGQSAVAGRNFTGSDNNGLYSNPTPLGLSNDPNTPPTQVPQLGTYDLNGNSALVLTGAQLQGILGSSQTTVTATRLEYRVYLSGTATNMLPSYTSLAFNTTQSGSTTGSIYNGSVTSTISLLGNLTSGGTYVLDVRFASVASRNSTSRTSYDPSSDYFYANFVVTPPPITPPGGTTTWQSTTDGPTSGSTDWMLAANWSNGVPNSKANVIIPAKNAANQVYPQLSDNTQTFAVNNLTLNGSGSTAAQLIINSAALYIYGDLNQRGGGISGGTTIVNGATSSANSTIIFAGNNQLITGTLTVSDIIIGGSGTKSVINSVNPLNIIALMPNSATDGVIIQSAAYDVNGNVITSYSFDTSGNSYVDLGSTAIISVATGQLETTTAYIRGVLKSNRTLSQGNKQSFGNAGIDVTPNHTPGTIVLFRVVGEALGGPASTSVPTKRRYRLEGDDNSTSNVTASSNIDIVFHYLPSVDELNGIKEENLALFSTVNNGAPYTGLGGTLDVTAHTVSRATIPSLSKITFTLGDKTNPLPVSLVAFAAVRSAANTLLSWTTASEQNNKGFNVQVSADGVNYRTLAFVASKSPNSSNELNYKYTDVEVGKAGTRYYRLEQVDEDGTLHYSPVRAVGFDGIAATSVALVAYPNPFSDTIGLTVEGATTTEGVAYVKLVDMTGRTVLDQKLNLSGASLTLGDVSGLRSGLYLAKVTLPDGTVQTVRLQKQ